MAKAQKCTRGARTDKYDLQQCRHCWRRINVRTAWAQPPVDTFGRFCRHLGMATGETVVRPTKTGRVELPLLTCAVYGKCTVAKPVSGIACCSCAKADGGQHICPSFAARKAVPRRLYGTLIAKPLPSRSFPLLGKDYRWDARQLPGLPLLLSYKVLTDVWRLQITTNTGDTSTSPTTVNYDPFQLMFQHDIFPGYPGPVTLFITE